MEQTMSYRGKTPKNKGYEQENVVVIVHEDAFCNRSTDGLKIRQG